MNNGAPRYTIPTRDGSCMTPLMCNNLWAKDLEVTLTIMIHRSENTHAQVQNQYSLTNLLNNSRCLCWGLLIINVTFPVFDSLSPYMDLSFLKKLKGTRFSCLFWKTNIAYVCVNLTYLIKGYIVHWDFYLLKTFGILFSAKSKRFKSHSEKNGFPNIL